MKILFLSLLCGLALCACQQKQNGYTVEGNIRGGADGMKVMLVDVGVYPEVIVDSTVIQDETFRFQGKLEFPGMHRLLIDKKGKGEGEDMLTSDLYIENSKIRVDGHIDSMKTYFWSDDSFRKELRVTGSATQDLYNQYRASVNDLGKKSAELNEKYLEVYHRPAIDGVFNTEEGVAVIKQVNELDKQLDIARWNFIEQHPESVVGYDLAMQSLEGMYVGLTVPQIDQLTKIILKGWAAYPERVEKFKTAAEKAKKMALGAKYQDIELMNPEGKMVKLSEYVPEGKYVMLEFWASWCGPCRGEIPHLRHVYREYKDKGFVIVSISIDERKADWDKAMKEENMMWKQLNDPKGFNGPVCKQYNITGVPTCILLDKEGRIFKTEMRGAALDAVLQELYPD